MPTERWLAADFMGFTPAIERRRSDRIYAIDGRNFIFDSRGPKSVFGNTLLLPQPIQNSNWIQGQVLKLRDGDVTFTFVSDAILVWDEQLGGWRHIYHTPDTSNTPYRWTWGYLNELVYFAHPAVGILVYDPFTGICGPHKGPGVPEEVVAICVNNGRLIAVSPIFTYWSEQSNGLNFRPQLAGAGFQKISDHVSGFPRMVTSYPQGILTWTTGGVMRSEFTGDSAVYRHRALNTEYRLINSFCSAQIDDNTTVILDERGLFQSKGEAPTPYTPLFNEFLIDYLQRLKLRIGDNVRIEWDDLQRLMYVSISLSVQNPRYEHSFVLYPPMDKWGLMTEHHYGILPIIIKQSSRENRYFAFVDGNRKLRIWRDIGYREAGTPPASANLVYPLIQKPAFATRESVVILSSSCGFNTIPFTQYPRAGYYLPDGISPLITGQTGLDSKVQLGLIRFQELNTSNDQLAEVTELSIGSVLSGDPNLPGADFNTTPPGFDDEDLNDGNQNAEDFGFEVANFVNHRVRVVGTVDGITTFVEQSAELVRFFRGIRYYSCIVSGVWHIIELSAVDPGERFHVQSLELTASYGGKFN